MQPRSEPRYAPANPLPPYNYVPGHDQAAQEAIYNWHPYGPKQDSAQQGSDNAYGNVAHRAVVAGTHDLPGEPTRGQADHDEPDEVHEAAQCRSRVAERFVVLVRLALDVLSALGLRNAQEPQESSRLEV